MASDATGAPDGIAIVGMAGRFPGSDDLEAYWDNLARGVESIRFFDRDELLAAGNTRESLDQHGFVPASGYLAGADRFDAHLFGFSQRDAELTDPQHRLFLETAWAALESAGYDPESYDGSIGVIGGMSASSYLFRNLLGSPTVLAEVDPGELRVRNDKDFLTSMVAYKLGLTGPSFTVQSACSTSLVAVALACQSLMTWQCDMVLAGGVSVGSPTRSGFAGHGQLFDADGHCRPFDADASGTPTGYGVGIVVLKRLAEALADGDRIRAVVRGFGINNDGGAKPGYTAPGVDGQAEVVAMAQAMAGVSPETIGFVEAHGTATPLGDPIEVEALTRAFRLGTDARGYCALGSVKSNIGHLDAAAGIASLVKTVLALEHGQVPPTLHFRRPNPEIAFEETPFHVNPALIDWPGVHERRRAGVSAFAVGGMNAHLVLEEAPPHPPAAPASPPHLLVLSAKTEAALEAMTDRLVDHLRRDPEQSLADVCYTLQVGRRALDRRRAVVCRDREAAIEALSARTPETLREGRRSARRRPVYFLFPGLGEQYPDMGIGLYRTDAVFRQEIDRCSDFLEPLLGRDLRTVLYPGGSGSEATAAEADHGGRRSGELDLRALMSSYREPREDREIDRTLYAQPAMFCVEWALARVWLELGVEPDALLGFSLGEYAAACVAGVFSLEDALRLVAERARIVSDLAPGAMLAVPLSEEEVRHSLGDELSIAAVNGPAASVVAGPVAAIEALESELAEHGTVAMRLHASHAFHTPLMAPVRRAVVDLLRDADLRPPRLPLLSNVTGSWLEAEQATDPEYWGDHLVSPVRFADDLATLWRQPDGFLLEVGPGRTLGALALQHPGSTGARRAQAIPSLRGEAGVGSDRGLLLDSVAELWLAGAARIRWQHLHDGAGRLRVTLPDYPFERERAWIEPPRRRPEPAEAPHAATETTAPAWRPTTQPAPRASDEREPAAWSTPRVRRPRPDVSTPFVPPSSELEAQIAAAWQSILGLEGPGVHDDFFALGGDSMVGPRLLLEIHRSTGTALTLRTLFQTPTIAGMARRIEQIRAGEGEGAEVGRPVDLEARAVLDPEIVPAAASVGEPAEARSVLLTGATGFLGAFLAADLVRAGVERLHCLVRAGDPEEGMARIRASLRCYEVWDDRFEEVLIAVPGDLGAPRLGLSEPELDRLAGTVEAVYHCGAWVNTTYHYDELEPANVLGTQEALRLAARQRTKPFHFISTLAVFTESAMEGGRAYEHSEPRAVDELPTGYVQSKWVAERLVLEARRRGLPASIFRAPGIGGHSETGLGNLRDFGWNLMKGCIQMGAGFRGTQRLDIAPVDYVSRTIVHASRRGPAGETFHVSNHRILDWTGLFRSLRDLGYDLEILSYAEWYARLEEVAHPAGDQALIPFLSLMPEPSVFEARAAEDRIAEDPHDDTNTRRALEGSGILCPPLDTALLATYVRSFVERGFLPEPAPAASAGSGASPV